MDNYISRGRKQIWGINIVKLRKFIWSFMRVIWILGIAYIIIFPILSKVSSSLMTEADLYDKTVKWIPRHFTFENYKLVWQHMKYPSAFLNSFLLSITVGILQLLSCTLIGYGLARFKFRGRGLLFGIVIFMLIVPPQVIMIPLYLNFRYFNLFGLIPDGGINLLNSYWPFILTSLTGTGIKNGLFIFIMRQYFRGMPTELEEAAYVDGAGSIRTFFSIMAPGAVPAMLIVFLFSFVWQWNDNYFISIFMSNANLLANNLSNLVMNITSGELEITRQYLSLLNNTGSLLFIAPVLLIYAFLQRYFIESIERSGLVG